MSETFLFDTYALIELLNKNPKYEKYADCNTIVNEFIFAEFCYQLIKNEISDYDEYLDEVEPAIVRLSPNTMKKAMEFRYKNKKRKMSMTDCISYIQAKEFGIKFLTGDKEFADLENVEFVKK